MDNTTLATFTERDWDYWKIKKTTLTSLDFDQIDGILHFTMKPSVRPTTVNADLMLKVLNTITRVDGLWDQTQWRAAEITSFDRLSPDEQAAASEALDQRQNPSCGTAMCFAGWATQIAKAPFTITTRVLNASERFDDAPTKDVIYVLEGSVLMPRDSGVVSEPDDHPMMVTWGALATAVPGEALWGLRQEIVQDHGQDVFEKRKPVLVENAATSVLGIGSSGANPGLFRASNDLADVVRYVDAYLTGDNLANQD